MAVAYNPGIVTDGLVLCLDAANKKSYPGTGTTWNDLSGRSNTGTLINGPTFSESNLGSIVVDGVDDYIDLQNKSDLTVNNFSYSCWYYPTAYQSGQVSGIFSRENARHYVGYGPTGRYIIFLRGNQFPITGAQSEQYVGNAGAVQLNTYQNTTVTIDWSNSIFAIYHNANLIWSTTNTSLGNAFVNSTIQDAVIGSRYAGASTIKLIGRVSNFCYYNKILSPNEITQNFNALRGRFGI